ncbi:MAG: DUF6057 family protein [Prevotella sp.]|jgi:hypothetical protein
MNKHQTTTLYHYLLTLIFGIAVFAFWVYLYPGMLNFHEQYQLFLFNTDYFMERISRPGGLADYISEFLVQFYYVPALGGLVIALLMMLQQRMCYRLQASLGISDGWYALSFVPSVVLWCYQTDENALLSFTVALTLLIPLMAAYVKVSQNRLSSALWLFIGVSIIYWLLGAVVLVYVAFALAHALLTHRNPIIEMLSLVWALAFIWISAQWLPYPLYRLYGGLHYFRFPAVIPYMQMVVMVFFALWPLVPLRILPVSQKPLTQGIILACLIVGTVVGLWLFYHPAKRESLEYDRLVRLERWDDVIRLANHHQPSTPMEVSCLNLALQMKGQMADNMFHYFQHGTDGLIPPFQREFTTPVPTSEIFYRVGLINDAERYAFEAQEAIPDFSKSGRLYKRLAECEIVNGHYAVAARFLRKLQQSMFYKSWADSAMTCLWNEQKVNANPEWKRLRAFRLTKDNLFSEKELDQFFGLLYAHNYSNRMAFEYLLAWQLLKGDLGAFNKYYPLGRFAGYDHIPRSYQEALVYMWTQTHPNFQGMPYSIEPEVCQQVIDFARIYVSNPKSPELTQGVLGQTYWSYLLCKNKN